MEILMVLALILAVASMYGAIIILVYSVFSNKTQRIIAAALISVFGALMLATSIMIAPHVK